MVVSVMDMKKFLLVILDGAADRKRSAFAKAKKPHFDMLAENSSCGLWKGPHAPQVHGRQGRHFAFNPRSMSSVATLEILGYSYMDEPGRGYLEALGLGLKPKKHAVYVRGNFAFVSGRKIIDRRAGRDESGLDGLVAELNSKIRMIKTVRIKVHRLFGHRVIVVLDGRGLSRRVTDNDIGKDVKKIKALDKKAKKTSDILNEFSKKAYEILSKHAANKKRKIPANFILLRSAGAYQKVESFREKYKMRACSISGVNIISGTSRYLGIDVIGMRPSQLEHDLPYRVKKAMDALEKYDFVILHINGADTLAHNKDFAGKVKYIERIDREVFSQLLKMRTINISVISDHITDSKTGEHVFGPVPFLVYLAEEEHDGNKKFDETCRDFVTDSPMAKILNA